MNQTSSVLLIHGDDSLRLALAAQLTQDGGTVQATADAAEALRLLRSLRPDVACVGAGGSFNVRSLCEALRRLGIPVLLVGEASSIGPGRGQEWIGRLGVDTLLLPTSFGDVGTAARLLARRQVVGHRDVARGLLSEFGCFPLLRALLGLGRSAIVALERDGRRGELRIGAGGQLDSAQRDGRLGLAALYQLLLWREGFFDVRWQPLVQRHEMSLTRDEVLAEGMRFLRDFSHQAADWEPLDRPWRIGRVPAPIELGGVVALFARPRPLGDALDDSPFGPFETLTLATRLRDMGALVQQARHEIVVEPEPEAADLHVDLPLPIGYGGAVPEYVGIEVTDGWSDEWVVPEQTFVSGPTLLEGSQPVAVEPAPILLDRPVERGPYDRMRFALGDTAQPTAMWAPSTPAPEPHDTTPMPAAELPTLPTAPAPSNAPPPEPVRSFRGLRPPGVALPTVRAGAGKPTREPFTPLEEAFFGQVDEFGRMPQLEGPVETFDDLDASLPRRR
jgi:hypothetical protein